MPFEIASIYRHKDAFGLDIGTHTLKICQLKKSGRLTKLVGYGSASIPEGVIVEGIISDPEEIAKITKKLISQTPWGEITGTRVVASMPESKLFTRILELPEMDTKKLEEALYWESEQYIPVPVADLYLDHEIIKHGKKSKNKKDKQMNEVMLVAAPKSIVDSYLQVLKILDLEPAAIEMGLAAMTRALITPKMTGATLIANIGADATDAGIVLNGILRLSGSTPTGGDNITQAISDKLKISKKEAEEIKKKFGITDWGLKDKVVNAVDPVLDIIIGEIDRVMKYYQERIVDSKNNKIERMLLTGGTASMPGVAEYIQEKTNIPTEIGNPWSNITVYPLKPVTKTENPVYTTAIGLSLRGIQPDE